VATTTDGAGTRPAVPSKTVSSAVAPPETGSSGWFLRIGPSAAVLAIVLFSLAQLTDPAGYLSTDVGGKTATIEVIVEDGPRAPDLGYWAETLDPEGRLYPMWSTARVNGSWVNVTTLPMLYFAAPLWKLGGARAAVLVPVLGTVLAAAAAAAIARRLEGTRRQQATAFWLVGLASPATIYALDFWEHSLGLGLVLWGIVAVLDSTSRARVAPWVPVAAGLAFSTAAALRQEALVYGFLAGVVLVAHLFMTGRPLTALLRGAGMLIGTAAGLAANAAFEWWVFGTTLRAGRGGGTAAAAGTDLVVRAQEALITGVGPLSGTNASALLLAAVLLGLLLAIGVGADRPLVEQRVIWAGLAAVALLVVLDLIVDGMRFIPGLAATTPLAVLGVVRGGGTGPRRAVTAVSLMALPVVWLTQFAGGATAQWGGRYTLPSAMMLLVVAVVSYDTGRARSTMRAVAIAGLVITMVGVGWTVRRTHGFADASRALADRPEEALVFRDPFLAREPGPLGLDEQWLAAPTPELLREASEVLVGAGIEQVGYVDFDIGRAVPDLPGYVFVGESTIPLVNDLRLRVVSLEREG
jgi:hypothetical protein